jgi:hypothetical protein
MTAGNFTVLNHDFGHLFEQNILLTYKGQIMTVAKNNYNVGKKLLWAVLQYNKNYLGVFCQNTTAGKRTISFEVHTMTAGNYAVTKK